MNFSRMAGVLCWLKGTLAVPVIITPLAPSALSFDGQVAKYPISFPTSEFLQLDHSPGRRVTLPDCFVRLCYLNTTMVFKQWLRVTCVATINPNDTIVDIQVLGHIPTRRVTMDVDVRWHRHNWCIPNLNVLLGSADSVNWQAKCRLCPGLFSLHRFGLHVAETHHCDENGKVIVSPFRQGWRYQCLRCHLKSSSRRQYYRHWYVHHRRNGKKFINR